MNRAWCAVAAAVLLLAPLSAQEPKKQEAPSEARRKEALKKAEMQGFVSDPKIQTHGQLQMKRAEIMADVGDWETAEGFMILAFKSEADKEHPQRLILHARAGEIFTKGGKPAHAIAQYNAVEALLVGNGKIPPSRFFLDRSHAYEILKKYPEAIADLEKAIKGAAKEEAPELQKRLDALKKRK